MDNASCSGGVLQCPAGSTDCGGGRCCADGGVCCTDGTCAPNGGICCNNGYFCSGAYPTCCGSRCCPANTTCNQTTGGCIRASGATALPGTVPSTPAPPGGQTAKEPQQAQEPSIEGSGGNTPGADDYGLGYGCGGCGNDPASDGDSGAAGGDGGDSPAGDEGCGCGDEEPSNGDPTSPMIDLLDTDGAVHGDVAVLGSTGQPRCKHRGLAGFWRSGFSFGVLFFAAFVVVSWRRRR